MRGDWPQLVQVEQDHSKSEKREPTRFEPHLVIINENLFSSSQTLFALTRCQRRAGREIRGMERGQH
jgi:hypothetical protein